MRFKVHSQALKAVTYLPGPKVQGTLSIRTWRSKLSSRYMNSAGKWRVLSSSCQAAAVYILDLKPILNSKLRRGLVFPLLRAARLPAKFELPFFTRLDNNIDDTDLTILEPSLCRTG